MRGRILSIRGGKWNVGCRWCNDAEGVWKLGRTKAKRFLGILFG